MKNLFIYIVALFLCFSQESILQGSFFSPEKFLADSVDVTTGKYVQSTKTTPITVADLDYDDQMKVCRLQLSGNSEQKSVLSYIFDYSDGMTEVYVDNGILLRYFYDMEGNLKSIEKYYGETLVSKECFFVDFSDPVN